jgi:hypothetical protein
LVCVLAAPLDDDDAQGNPERVASRTSAHGRAREVQRIADPYGCCPGACCLRAGALGDGVVKPRDGTDQTIVRTLMLRATKDEEEADFV